MNVLKLKEQALRFHDELSNAKGFFARRKIRNRLAEILDEIEYQEGRKQYANRPYSFPTARKCTRDPMRCQCGCWLEARRRIGWVRVRKA